MRTPGNILLVAVFSLSILLGMAAVPPKAEAMCAYSDDWWYSVTLDCGWACWNHWQVPENSHRCRPGKGGKVTVEFPENLKCVVKVDAHGWVDMTTSNTGASVEYKVQSHHHDGSVHHTCYRFQ